MEWAHGSARQKKMVPSDSVPASLTAGMHGIELRSEEHRAPGLSAPLQAVFPPAGSMLPSTPQSLLLSSLGPETRNGLSLTRNDLRLRGLHSGVNVPSLLLRLPRYRCATRSAFRSAAENSSPRFSAASSRGPVAAFLLRSARGILASTPLWGLYPPPDRSVQPVKPPAGPPSESARSPFAPSLPSYC